MADQDEQAAAWAQYRIKEYGLDAERWGVWVCCDCDPRNADPDEEEVHEHPCIVVGRLPADADADGDPRCPQDYCPRCGDYLPFLFATEVSLAPVTRSRSPSAG